MNMNASGPFGPDVSTAERVTKQAGFLGLGAGALIGAGAATYDIKKQQRQGLEGAQARVQQLSETQDGTFAQAAALARAKTNLARGELLQAHPGRTMGARILSSALRGGIAGSSLENNVRYLMG
jgi:hypothetical protein